MSTSEVYSLIKNRSNLKKSFDDLYTEEQEYLKAAKEKYQIKYDKLKKQDEYVCNEIKKSILNNFYRENSKKKITYLSKEGKYAKYKSSFNHVWAFEYKIEDLCYSIQETIFAMLIEVSERAMAHCGKSELLFGGGVCCNKRLQEMAKVMCSERNGKLFVPENQFLVDNAAMIAWLGLVMSANKENLKKIETAGIKPYERTDDVEVNWS